MEIKSKIFKIEINEKPTLDFFENWFLKNNINPVRYAITDIKDNVLTLDCAYITH